MLIEKNLDGDTAMDLSIYKNDSDIIKILSIEE